MARVLRAHSELRGVLWKYKVDIQQFKISFDNSRISESKTTFISIGNWKLYKAFIPTLIMNEILFLFQFSVVHNLQRRFYSR